MEQKNYTDAEVSRALANKLPGYLTQVERNMILYAVMTELDKISAPKEEFAFGALYRDKNGEIWKRTHGGSWFKMGDKTNYANDVPVRPLTRVKLVNYE